MKKIFVLSAGRSDYDRYFPIIKELRRNRNVNLYLVPLSAHYATKFGNTFSFISEKFKIIKQNKIYKSYSDKPTYLIERFAKDLLFLSKKINIYKPDLLIVLGDRFEMLLGPITSIPNNIPVIHFFGGAVTEGAVDELTRHAITKLSHYHFVALNDYKKRLIQLGEEEWRVKVSGVHSINLLKTLKKNNSKELSKKLGINLINFPYLLVTFHSVTLEQSKTKDQIYSLINAIKKTKLKAIFTYPNADVGSNKIIKVLNKELKNKKKYKIIKNCGAELYVNLIRNCLTMVGNSSSAIVEAASFQKPVINIGTRQDGKFKPKNVVNCTNFSSDIYNKILKLKNKKVLNKIKKVNNPYEAKITTKRIVEIILNIKRNNKVLRKKFIDIK